MLVFKKVVKSALWLALIIGSMILIFYIVLCIAVVPKTPATAEQVWEVLTSQGYEPQDITELYFKKDSGFKQILIKCVAFEKDDIHFEFFVFNNKGSAIDTYRQAYTQIILNRRQMPYAEHDTQIANYSIYTLESAGEYSVAIYVGATSVVAYCKEENSSKIGDILRSIDYF